MQESSQGWTRARYLCNCHSQIFANLFLGQGDDCGILEVVWHGFLLPYTDQIVMERTYSFWTSAEIPFMPAPLRELVWPTALLISSIVGGRSRLTRVGFVGSSPGCLSQRPRVCWLYKLEKCFLQRSVNS